MYLGGFPTIGVPLFFGGRIIARVIVLKMFGGSLYLGIR